MLSKNSSENAAIKDLIEIRKQHKIEVSMRAQNNVSWWQRLQSNAIESTNILAFPDKNRVGFQRAISDKLICRELWEDLQVWKPWL